VLGDLVSAGLGVQGMSWVTSPAATELEQHVLDWFAGLLGLPETFLSTGPGGGVVQDSSSGANLVALLAALHRAGGGETVRHGVRPDEYTVYVSAETHSSMEKAVRIAGLGSDAVRIVEVDGDLAMRPQSLRTRLERDVPAGTGRCWSAPPSGRRRRRPWTRSPSSAPSAATPASGCTWTPPMRG
jgi:Glutamate decarboxylase and related PLP-dependent proteins